MVVLVGVGVGGGGLLLNRRPSSPPEAPVPMANPVQNPTPPATPSAVSPTAPPEPGAPSPVFASPAPARPVPAPPPLSVGPDLKAIRAKIAMGDFYFARGDYDAAIVAYREGLKLDPANQVLRQKLEKVIKQCELENKVLLLNDKCGAPAAPPAPPASPKK